MFPHIIRRSWPAGSIAHVTDVLISPVAIALWAGSITLGFVLLLWHQGTAGPGAAVPETNIWAASQVSDAGPRLSNNGHTLLMFAHPRCPCTRASLRELERLLARTTKLKDVQIVVLRNPRLLAGWEQSPIVEFARRTQQLQVIEDEGGRWAEIYGARTSGHVFLYDDQGRLLFSGGITPARGHEGHSSGSAAILAHLRGEPAVAEAAVFGCSLFTSLPRN
jgi:hypothetical protein